MREEESSIWAHILGRAGIQVNEGKLPQDEAPASGKNASPETQASGNEFKDIRWMLWAKLCDEKRAVTKKVRNKLRRFLGNSGTMLRGHTLRGYMKIITYLSR